MKECLFCKIIEGKIPSYKIWEDKKHFAFLDINPMNPGHTLLVPKKHGDYVFDLENKEYSELMLASKKVAKIIKQKITCKRIGVAIEGFEVPHIHIHLVPINKGNELNPERARRANEEELKKVKDMLTSK